MGAVRKQENLDDRWMGLVAAQRLLGVSRLKVLTLSIKGDLEAKHVAGRTIITKESVERFMARRNIA